MIGGTREESAFFLADDDAVWNGSLSEAELRQRVAAVAGAKTDELLAAYRTAMPQASPGDRLIAALTGSNFWIRTVLLAERYAARRRAPVYMYSLDWQSPAHDGRLKAHHAMDLPFVFDNADVADTTAGARGARELAARMSATWIAFARNGIPDNPAIPSWPAYTTEHRATMIFDTTCRLATRPRPRGAAVVDPRRPGLSISTPTRCWLPLLASWTVPPCACWTTGKLPFCSIYCWLPAGAFVPDKSKDCEQRGADE